MTSNMDTSDGDQGIETELATLQPIRDLARNWDIDIASCLEEYLHDIVGELSVEDQERVANHVKLNFAQAALVLQNSCNIYSRKVEYLYSLVYKALDELSVAGRDGASSKNGKKSSSCGDADINEFLNFDPHQEFLLLDDILPTDDTENCRKINLNEEPIELNRTLASFQSPRSTTRLSITAMTDRSTSSVNAAFHRTLVGSLDTGSLRLVGGACDIGEDGLLRMPGTNSARRDPPAADFADATPARGMDFEASPDDNDDFGGGGGDDDDDDDEGGGGFDLAGGFDDDDDAPPEPPVEEAPKRRVTFADTVVKKQPEKTTDPWELLDPHKPDGKNPRPLRIGKTIRLPAGLSEPPSECVTGARTRRITRRERPPVLRDEQVPKRSLATATFKAALAARKRSHDEFNETDDSIGEKENAMRPAVPLKGLAFGNEFAYIAKATAKRKAAERRERRKQQLATQTAIEVEEVDEEDEGGGFAYGGDENDDDFDFGGGGGFDDDENENGPIEGNTGMVTVDDVFKMDDDVLEGGTFEELCRAHIQAFAKGAEKYAAETKLSQRVGQWQSRLVPLLEEEDQRSVFDIHAYGQAVIDTMEETIQKRKTVDKDAPPNNIVDFRDVTRNRPQYEVCRLFLASLSLANSGNVGVGNDESIIDGTSLSLELLDSEIERPMETYLAPSATEAWKIERVDRWCLWG